MGGKTTTSSSSTELPKYLDNAYKDLIKAGSEVASQPYEQYTGSRVAGFTPQQYEAFDMTSQMQGMGLPYVNAAAEGYGNVAGMNWGAVPTNTVDSRGLAAASKAVMPTVDQYDWGTLQAYMDPYLQGVLNPTLEAINRQNAQQISDLKGSGISMGISPALGDRMGLAAADLAGQQALATNQVISDLYSQGFQNAQSQLAAQQQLQLQGGTSDQQRLLEVANLRQQGRQADADRLLASMGYQQQGGLAAAQGIAGLGTQAQDLTAQGIDYLLNAGGMQQQLGQIQLDQAYADWKEKQDYDKQQTDWLASLIYGSPGSAATTTTTEQPAPSLFSQIAGLGMAGAGLLTSKRGGAVRRAPGGMVPRMRRGMMPMIRRAPGGMVPMLNVGDFQVASGWPAGVPSGLEPSTTGVYEGDWYINALPNLTAKQVGHENKEVKLDKDLRRIFRDIGDWNNKRGGNGGGGGGNGGGGGGDGNKGGGWGSPGQGKGSEFTADGRPIIRRWPDGSIKTIGGEPVYHSRGGPVRRAPGGAIPGTPEYDAEIEALLNPPATTEVAPPTADGLGAAALGPGPRTGFFANKNLPLIYAGLGIAAGNSPWPLQNVGSGALAGLGMAQRLEEQEMQLDANPTIDDSGPTIRIWYPSERRWEDTGIPTARWEAAKGTTGGDTGIERYLFNKYGANYGTNPDALEEWGTSLSKPTTSVTVGSNEGSKTFSGGMADQGIKIVEEANSAAARAQDLELIATMAQNPDVYTGTFGESVDSLKRFAGTVLGLPIEGMTEGEIIRQTQAQAVGRLRGLLPGPMSDGDRAFLLTATAGLNNSTEGIMMAAEIARMQADSMTRKKSKLIQLMQEAERDPNDAYTATNALGDFQVWMDMPENRVFTPETLAGAQKRAAARAAAAGGQHRPTAGTGGVWEKYGVPPPGGAP